MPIRGDRRDHFEAETDIWEMFLRIAAGPQGARDRSGARGAAAPAPPTPIATRAVTPIARARLKDMLAFIEMMERWYAQMLSVPKPQIATAISSAPRC